MGTYVEDFESYADGELEAVSSGVFVQTAGNPQKLDVSGGTVRQSANFSRTQIAYQYDTALDADHGVDLTIQFASGSYPAMGIVRAANGSFDDCVMVEYSGSHRMVRRTGGSETQIGNSFGIGSAATEYATTLNATADNIVSTYNGHTISVTETQGETTNLYAGIGAVAQHNNTGTEIRAATINGTPDGGGWDGSFVRLGAGTAVRVRMANGDKASVRLANGDRL